MDENFEQKRIARQQARQQRRRRRRIRMAVAMSLMIVLCVGVIGIFGFYLPWRDAESTMPADGKLTLVEQTDGTVELSWPQGEHVDSYRVEIFQSGQVVHTQDVGRENHCLLSALPRDSEVTIRVSTLRVYRTLLANKMKLGKTALEATGTFAAPTVKLSWEVQLQPQGVKIAVEKPEQVQCRMYLSGEDTQPVCTLENPETVLIFGDEGELPLPSFEQAYEFCFRICREGDGFIHYGLNEQNMIISREALLGTVLGLTCTDEGSNAYTLRWNETRGESYEIQRMKPGSSDWTTVCTVTKAEPRLYTTPHLQRYSEYRYRIIVHGLAHDEDEVRSEQVIILTGATAVYSTVWPLCDLTIYADSQKQQMIGTAPEAEAYCVLDVQNDMFLIRQGDLTGYIDGNYCMINLPEYLGDICTYDIANSYDSLYMAHGYELPGVTGTVILGYENVLTSQGDYLVPLLYPVAQRLEEAAFEAMAQGYRLKIYDTYRPGDASTALYNKAMALSNTKLPDYPYNWDGTGKPPAEGGKLTYKQLMTDNGRYTMSYFLAAKGSRHNQGLAIDLTLERLDNREELIMQSAMHDLSWYSELKRNNVNARVLASIMEGVGFNGLSSEWWHFQDDEVRKELGIDFYLAKGVSGECWMANDNGWQYRQANGRYHANTTVTIDGVEYTFDEAGYAVRP